METFRHSKIESKVMITRCGRHRIGPPLHTWVCMRPYKTECTIKMDICIGINIALAETETSAMQYHKEIWAALLTSGLYRNADSCFEQVLLAELYKDRDRSDRSGSSRRESISYWSGKSLPLPSLPSPSVPFFLSPASPPYPCYLPLPTLPSSPSLEVGPLYPARGVGQRCKLPHRVRAEPGQQTISGAFGAKTALFRNRSSKSFFCGTKMLIK